jgi:hypothetical protein
MSEPYHSNDGCGVVFLPKAASRVAGAGRELNVEDHLTDAQSGLTENHRADNSSLGTPIWSASGSLLAERANGASPEEDRVAGGRFATSLG